MKRTIFAILLLLFAIESHANSTNRFLGKLKLETGETIVVAEGDFEAESIGSFSIRIYEPAGESDETTFFLSGAIHSRDGSVEKIVIDKLNDNLAPEIIIVTRSVGTGNYLSAYVFEYSNNTLNFLFSKEGLPPDTNLIKILKVELNNK